MTDRKIEPTIYEATEWLESKRGQSYFISKIAWSQLRPFWAITVGDFTAEHDPYAPDEDVDDYRREDRLTALSHRLKDKQRTADDAKGFITAWPHEQIVTASDVSAILVEAIGEEPSDASMLGNGSTADARHDSNMKAIREALPDDIETLE